MALSDEQNAMLRLLASGEQGYDDIAALMGLSVAEVRAKVVGALAQLEAEGKPAPAVPPPVPGGANPAAEVDPPEPEPVAEAPAGDDDEPAIAEQVAPQTPVPGARSAAGRADPASPASPPKRAGPVAVPSASPSPTPRHPGGGRTITLPTGRNAWLLGGGAVAAIVVIVLVIVLVSGGSDDNSSTTPSESASAPAETTGAETAAQGGNEPTEAKLVAVDGSEAEGRAAFGRVEEKLALQVEATGLEPTTGSNSYTLWLAQSPEKMLPLAFPIAVKGSGKGANAIAAQFEVPVEILAYLAAGTFDQISITRTDDDRLEASLKAATEAKTAPTYHGEPVLRGTIKGQIIGIAKREEEAKKAEEAGR